MDLTKQNQIQMDPENTNDILYKNIHTYPLNIPNKYIRQKCYKLMLTPKSRRKSLIQRWLMINMINKNKHAYAMNIPNIKWNTFTRYIIGISISQQTFFDQNVTS